MADESKEAKANGPAAPKQFAIVAAGRINDPALHMARVVLRSLASENSRVTWEVLEFTEADWEVYLAAKLKVRSEGARQVAWVRMQAACLR